MLTAKRRTVPATRTIVGGLLFGALLFGALLSLAACAHVPGMPPPLAERRDISVTAWSWGFDPAVVQVRQGERVRLTVRSLDVAHSLVNDRLGLRFAIPARGEEPAIHEFTVPEFGDYGFHSETPSGPGVGRMQFRLVVMR